ncbi:Lrp/AsnC family transcriptional regulator [Catelliglobosispora koreensis]|uniref:Lrp/AsnC family transcriptional regulator n=1 Tax=Catelliglobosispora koreensis TaxID=129052 RepID=UPI0003678469|nr:Lrp/AsnC family transcriptional regulator [Catelliglobosispora koreensis]
MDAIDRSIVDLLRRSARLSYAELARKVGLSAPAVHERVGKLETAGVLRGYHADVEPHAIDLGVTAIIGLVANASDQTLDDLRAMEEIESCYFMAGDESYLVKVRVASIDELEHVIVRLSRIQGVSRTRTMIALSTKWEGRPRPLTSEAS